MDNLSLLFKIFLINWVTSASTAIKAMFLGGSSPAKQLKINSHNPPIHTFITCSLSMVTWQNCIVINGEMLSKLTKIYRIYMEKRKPGIIRQRWKRTNLENLYYLISGNTVYIV